MDINDEFKKWGSEYQGMMCHGDSFRGGYLAAAAKRDELLREAYRFIQDGADEIDPVAHTLDDEGRKIYARMNALLSRLRDAGYASE